MNFKIRASMLSNYCDCPRRAVASYYRKQVCGFGFNLRDSRNSILSAVGTSIHASGKFMMDGVIEMGVPGNIKDSIECGMQALREQCEDGVFFDPSIPNKNRAEQCVKSLALVYRNSVVPICEPLATEFPLRGVIDNVLITGTPDLNTKRGIRDTKSTVKEKSHHAQVGMYALMQKTDLPPVIDYLDRKKLTHKAVEYEIKLCKRVAYFTAKRIIADLREFFATEIPVILPCNPSSMLCSEKYCTAYGTFFCELTGGK